MSRVFDWIKAATLLTTHKPTEAVAGLSTDLFWTAGTIWDDGAPCLEAKPYLASNWATPVLIMDDGDEVECWVYMDNEANPHGWDASTVWPPDALAIVNGPTVIEDT